MQLEQALLYDFELRGRRVRLWKRLGESYEHVLMKALAYAMNVGEFPQLEIESDVGLRYRPDLVARRDEGDYRARRFPFWGECGATAMRKVNWLLKHADIGRLVLFKLSATPAPLLAELRSSVELRQRAGGRLRVVSFTRGIVARAAERQIECVPESWYKEFIV